MSEHINPPAPDAENFHALGLSYIAEELGVSRGDARLLIRRMHDNPWMDAPVQSMSAAVLPSAEDGITKLRERHPDLVEYDRPTLTVEGDSR